MTQRIRIERMEEFDGQRLYVIVDCKNRTISANRCSENFDPYHQRGFYLFSMNPALDMDTVYAFLASPYILKMAQRLVDNTVKTEGWMRWDLNAAGCDAHLELENATYNFSEF